MAEQRKSDSYFRVKGKSKIVLSLHGNKVKIPKSDYLTKKDK